MCVEHNKSQPTDDKLSMKGRGHDFNIDFNLNFNNIFILVLSLIKH